MKFLVDTDVFINLSRSKLTENILFWDGSEAISDVSYMEFIQGCRNNRELIIWKKVSQRFVLIPVSGEISYKARNLMEDFSLSHGLTMGDAFIAATAMIHQLTLVTSNKKHFIYIPGIETKFIKL